MVSATASIVAAMGAAFLFPYVRSMIAAVVAANREHDKL